MSNSGVECPTCGRDDFASVGGMRCHHKKVHGESIAEGPSTVTKSCRHCSDEFEVREGRAGDAKFCDPACHAQWRSESLSQEEQPNWKGGGTAVCRQCGQDFPVKPSREDEAKFCSYGCKGAWMEGRVADENHPQWKEKVEVECEYCGDVVEEHPSHAERRRFCSNDCHDEWRSENVVGEDHPLWKGGYDGDYGPNWKGRRHRARLRDQCRCQHCGMTGPEHLDEYGWQLEVHHLTPFREFVDEDGEVDYEAANALDNLLTLCRRCHKKAEQDT